MIAIVNVNPRWGIGNENKLLVRIHEDMRRFRALTSGHTIVIGRKTLETFPGGKPLPNRENIILTRNAQFEADGAIVCRDLPSLAAVLSERDADRVFLCGGEEVYRLLVPYCKTALVTLTDVSIKADRFFPNLNRLPNWILKSESEPGREGDLTYRFLEYENTEPLSF